MDQLILHAGTRGQLAQFAASPSHALLLTGADGIGKTALAEALVCQLLDIPAIANYPYYQLVSPTGTSISIESIRELQKFLQLTTTGTKLFRRAVVVEHAQALTTEAQNAFLKLLEEPPTDTVMVLTVHSPRALLPTIRSRVQTIAVHTPTQADVQPLLDASSKDIATRTQAYFLSGGLPGLLSALLSDDQEHPLLLSVGAAKDILQKNMFERLALADGLSKQKDTARAVLDALLRIAQTGLSGAASKQDAARLKQWHRIRKHTLAASQALSRSANAKLVLTDLFLNL